MASVLACESRSRRPVAIVSRPARPAVRGRHRCSSVERADTSDSSVDWWPPGTGPGERGYSARLLPGPGQHDELPGAACVKNRAASCSERHRSADRYLNAGHSRPGQAHPSTRTRQQGSVRYPSGTLARSVASRCWRNHDGVTSSWLGPLQSHIVVVATAGRAVLA